jgi:O-antigen/teichoic acid export membrane protein
LGAFRQEGIGQKFWANVSALTAARVLGTSLSVIQVIVVARWLGPTLYGVTALIMSYPNLFFGLLDVRSGQASVKFLSEFWVEGENERALALCKLGYVVDIGVGILTFLLVASTAWWAETRIVQTSGTAWMIVLFAASFIPRSLAGMSRAVMTTVGRFSLLALVESFSVSFRVILVLTLVLIGGGVQGVIWGNAIGFAIQGIALCISAYPVIKGTWGSLIRTSSRLALKGHLREIIRFMFYTDLNALVGTFVKQLDVVCVGFFTGPAEAGYYRLAKSIAAMTEILVRPLQSVIYPRFAALWGGKRFSELKETLKGYALFLGIPLCLSVLVGLVFIPACVRLTVGKAYLPATIMAQILVCLGATSLGLFWIRPLYLASGNVRLWFLLGLANSSFALLAYPIGATMLGAEGVAIGRLTAGMLRYGLAAVHILKGKII